VTLIIYLWKYFLLLNKVVFAKILILLNNMKNNIESHSSSVGTTSQQFLLPSGTQLLLYALIGILLVLALNLKNAWDYLNKTVLKPQGGLDRILAQKAPGLHHSLNSLSQSIALQVVFWIFVGCIVYVFIWFIRNITTNILNDIVADKYVHPISYNRSTYWGSILARKVFFWASITVLVLYLVSGTRLLVYLSDLAYRFTVDFSLSHSLLEFMQIIAAATGLIYLLILIVHIAVNSWHYMYKDL
jgi:hypothetical protein